MDPTEVALLTRSRGQIVHTKSASTLDSTAEPKGGWSLGFSPMGGSDSKSHAKVGQYPLTIFPTPLQLFSDSMNGTKPIALRPGSELYEKLVRIAQVVQTIAYAEKSSEDATADSKKDASARLQRASTFLKTLETKHMMSGVDVTDLVALALRNQSAESMRQNKALLTATDVSHFVAGFRGEDYGTHFNHDVSQKVYVSIQGDIMGSDHTFAGVEDTFNRAPGKIWPKGEVKYCYAKDTTARVKRVFEAAVQHYQSMAPFLHFEEVALLSNTESADEWSAHKCAAEHVIVVTSNPRLGCFSNLGMQEGSTQLLNLQDPGCTLVGTALHEIGHALGMAHDHPRSADDYSDDPNATYYSPHRVFKGRREYFSVDDSPLRLETFMLGEAEVKRMATQLHDGNISALAFESDPLSVMHYDPLAFEGIYYKDHKMSFLNEPDFERMGQRVGLSQFDVKHLVRLYGGATGSIEMPATPDTGCIDGYDADAITSGNGVCSSLKSALPWCSATARTHCCGCGGGVHYQCFSGLECSIVALRKHAYYLREELFGVGIVVLFIVGMFLMSKVSALAKRFMTFDTDSKTDVDGLEKESKGAMANARDSASGALKVLANWITTNAVPGNYTDKEHVPGQNKLPQECIERFKGSFAPFAGGFSSGRNAPAAPLIGGEDSVYRPRCMGEDPANMKKKNTGPYYRMHTSDSSDQEHSESSDAFERPIDRPERIDETTSDEDAPARALADERNKSLGD
eukprot:TRINITY_DN64029_c0_g1_i1.p1 TRINITY_DN64029_c0_g1~~TRINITY_DN64029_c0_g1_i1.p1  ORF type:complete len:867 (-),score=115.91 TRINITY_DN64029_c0_g1_i1:55-2280(-)